MEDAAKNCRRSALRGTGCHEHNGGFCHRGAAADGNSAYYMQKYGNYQDQPRTHEPVLGTSDPYYSNMGSFTVETDTDSALLEPDKDGALLAEIQEQVTERFKVAMGKVL